MYQDKLECPFCGGDFLHQIKVDVFERWEDQTTVFHVHTNMEQTVKSQIVNNERSNNPSLRRHAVSITFECEECSKKPILCLIQHKGCTYVEWRDKNGNHL